MKPIFNNVARTLKEEKSENIIAFVDATQEKSLGDRFKVKGFPTIKFFQDGEFAWDYSERDEQKILAFMRKYGIFLIIRLIEKNKKIICYSAR